MDFPVSFDLFIEMTGLGTGEHGNWIISEEGIRSAINTTGPFRNAHDERLRRMVAQQALLPFPTTATQLRQWEDHNDRITPPWFALVVATTARDAKDILSQEAEKLDAEKREAARQIALAKTSKDLPRHERMANAAMAEQEFNETLLRMSAINAVLTLIASNDHDKAVNHQPPASPAPPPSNEKSLHPLAKKQRNDPMSKAIDEALLELGRNVSAGMVMGWLKRKALEGHRYLTGVAPDGNGVLWLDGNKETSTLTQGALKKRLSRLRGASQKGR